MSIPLLERMLLSLVFGLAGLAKLFSLAVEVEAFVRWGFPVGFMFFIGILEVAGALGLWMKRLAAFSALCLAGLALGALVTRLWFSEWLAAGVTLLVLLVAIHFAWRERDELFPR